MKVFVAGGSGAMGRRLVPQLVAAGYEVSAMTRDEGKASWLGRVGAQPVIADALDRAAVVGAVRASEPEVVIHQLTALTGAKSFKNFDREFALTNRLRTEGTDHLLEAARIVGVRRVVAQSYGNWNYQRTGSAVKTEQDPFDPDPPANQVKSLQAIGYVENAVVNADGIEGIALRYGTFYGPGAGHPGRQHRSGAVAGAVEQTVRELGRIDILVNNAGIFTGGPLEEMTVEQVDRTLAIDVRAVFVAAQSAARHMSEGGRIITIGSARAERVPGPGMTVYAMCKSALIGLTKGLARDLGPRGITATAVQGGLIDTDMNPADGPGAGRSAVTALGRYGSADDIAATVAHLAGGGGRYASGTAITVDGGFTARPRFSWTDLNMGVKARQS